MKAVKGKLAVLALAALASGMLACGGSAKPEAESPVGQGPGQAPTGQVPQQGPLGQYGMSDAPTSGEAANRPKMNTAASQAYAAGLEAFQRGDLEGARSQFQKAGEADPKAYQAHYSLGVVQERLGQDSAARAAYKKAVGVVPDYEPAIVAYALLTARAGDEAAAEQYLQSHMAKMPKSAAIPGALAEVKSLQGDSGEAQRLAREALKRNPDYRPAMVTMARDHYRNRRLDLALYTLKGILDGFGEENPPRDKDNPEAHLLRGLINKEQGQRTAAIDAFQRAMELRPDLVEARVQLAAYMLESGNATDAEPLLEGALRYDSDNLLARLNLGDAYRLLGKTGEAKKQLEWVAKRDPKLAQVHYDLGLLYLFSEEVPGVSPTEAADKAIEELEKYKELAPRGSKGPDDTDELITRAKTKKAIIEAKQAEAAAAKAAATPAAGSGGATPPAGDQSSGSMPAAGDQSSGSMPAAEGEKKGGTSSGSLPPVK